MENVLFAGQVAAAISAVFVLGGLVIRWFVVPPLEKLIDEKTKFSKSKGEVKISVKKNDRDGYYLTLTKLRATTLKKKLDEIKVIKINNLEIEANKLVFKDNNNNSKIIFPDFIF